MAQPVPQSLSNLPCSPSKVEAPSIASIRLHSRNKMKQNTKLPTIEHLCQQKTSTETPLLVCRHIPGKVGPWGGSDTFPKPEAQEAASPRLVDGCAYSFSPGGMLHSWKHVVLKILARRGVLRCVVLRCLSRHCTAWHCTTLFMALKSVAWRDIMLCELSDAVVSSNIKSLESCQDPCLLSWA